MTIKDFTSARHFFFDEYYTCKKNKHWRIVREYTEKLYRVFYTEEINEPITYRLKGRFANLEYAIDFVNKMINPFDEEI